MIIDLRRDASKQSIAQAVRAMKVGGIDSVITKLTFRFMLLKRAYTKCEFTQFLRQTKFRQGDIQEDSIGLEIWLTKTERDTVN